MTEDLRLYDHHGYHFEAENRPDLSREYRYIETNILNPVKVPGTDTYNTERIKAEYNENSTQAVVLEGQHYKVWVERARVPSTSIPLMEWLPNYYYVYVDNGGATSNQVVQFATTSTVAGSVYGTNLIWNMWQIVDQIQTAITAACTAVGLAAADTPTIYFNTNTELFSIDFPTAAWVSATGNRKLYFNHNLFDLFQNFFYLEVAARRVPTVADAGREILIGVKNQGNNVSGTVYTMSQCHKTINLFYELSKIVITTSMNVRNSRVGGINLNNTTVQNASNSTTKLGVLTTFDFQYDDLTSTDLQYQPKNPRIIDILAKDEIIDVNYTFNYLTKTGRLEPIYLDPDTQADLMLGFRSMD